MMTQEERAEHIIWMMMDEALRYTARTTDDDLRETVLVVAQIAQHLNKFEYIEED